MVLIDFLMLEVEIKCIGMVIELVFFVLVVVYMSEIKVNRKIGFNVYFFD